MREWLKVLVACGGVLGGTNAATAAGHEEVLAAVPSGLPLQLLDQFLETQPDGVVWARFRFLLPQLAEVSFDQVEPDFGFLCINYALPLMQAAEESPTQIIISMSSEPVQFGSNSPNITQYFEVFSVQNDLCIWEAF